MRTTEHRKLTGEEIACEQERWRDRESEIRICPSDVLMLYIDVECLVNPINELRQGYYHMFGMYINGIKSEIMWRFSRTENFSWFELAKYINHKSVNLHAVHSMVLILPILAFIRIDKMTLFEANWSKFKIHVISINHWRHSLVALFIID